MELPGPDYFKSEDELHIESAAIDGVIAEAEKYLATPMPKQKGFFRALGKAVMLALRYTGESSGYFTPTS